ncbi:MAG TPA: M48 family metalloprotease [Usitatibacter sp.]|jgi:predicted Zn-dependent protease|nr:M48 family metalloprotease [Usitatibacter sp.]
MRALAVIALLAVSGAAGAQALLEFPDDYAFRREAVEAFAERAYRKNIEALATGDRLDRDPALLAEARALLDRLVDSATVERPDAHAIQWEVHTCRQCGEEASAMAGGKLLLGEEFVATMRLTEDELGFVLAHEAGHVLAEHTREFAGVARYFLDNGLHREYWDIQRELDNSFSVQLRMSFLSARQEDDADYIGFVVGSRAGLEPDAMLSLLAKLQDAAPAETFGTHPTRAHRLEQARAMLETARALHDRSRAR